MPVPAGGTATVEFWKVGGASGACGGADGTPVPTGTVATGTDAEITSVDVWTTGTSTSGVV